MTLQELITDLKAAGANENTIRLAMNCYELGRVNEREACADICAFVTWSGPWKSAAVALSNLIRARGQQ